MQLYTYLNLNDILIYVYIKMTNYTKTQFYEKREATRRSLRLLTQHLNILHNTTTNIISSI